MAIKRYSKKEPLVFLYVLVPYIFFMNLLIFGGCNENKVVHAVTLMNSVDHLGTITQLPTWEDSQAITEQSKSQIKSQMDPGLLTKAWNDGLAMTINNLVSYPMGVDMVKTEASEEVMELVRA